MYPAGHFGLTPVTFFVVFPFTHVIVVFFAVGLTVATTVAEGVGVGVGVAVATGVGVDVVVTTGAGVYFKVPRFNTYVWFGPP